MSNTPLGWWHQRSDPRCTEYTLSGGAGETIVTWVGWRRPGDAWPKEFDVAAHRIVRCDYAGQICHMAWTRQPTRPARTDYWPETNTMPSVAGWQMPSITEWAGAKYQLAEWEALTGKKIQPELREKFLRELTGPAKLKLTDQVRAKAGSGMAVGLKYVKHSVRTLRKGCDSCGSLALYYAHEVTGDADPLAYCTTCKVAGPLVIVDADTLTPHACTKAQLARGEGGPTAAGAGNMDADVEGDAPENDEVAPAPGEETEGSTSDGDAAGNGGEGGEPDPWLEFDESEASDGEASEGKPTEGDGDAEGEGQTEAEREAELIKAMRKALGNDQGDGDNDYVTHPELDAKASELVDFFADELGKAGEESREFTQNALKAALEAYKPQGAPTRVELIRPDGTAKQVEGLTHRDTPDLIMMLDCGEHTLMTGPAGTGKGEMARVAAEALELEFLKLPGSLSPQTPVSHIIGYMNSAGDYVGTLYRQAYEYGGLIFLDELDNAHPACLAAVNDSLAADVAAFPDGMVKRHDNFRCVAASNTYGRGPDRIYAARQRGDAATWDRFAILDVGYDTALEMACCQRTGAEPKVIDEVLRYVRALRKNAAEKELPVVVGMRASIGMCKMITHGVSVERVISARLRRGLSDQDWTTLVGDTRPLSLTPPKSPREPGKGDRGSF